MNDDIECVQLTKQMMVPFFPVYGWVGIWSCIFLLGLAAVEASSEVIHDSFVI